MKDFKYNFIGNIAVSDLDLFFSEGDWNSWTYKQTKWEVHSQTKSIPILIDESYETKGKKTKYFSKFGDLIVKIQDIIRKFYGDGEIIRIELVTLPKKSNVPNHYDVGESLQNDRRIHLVLQTNKNVIFTVDGEEKNMKVGEMWEINNSKYHSVFNNGDIDRIHMIIDFKKVNITLV